MNKAFLRSATFFWVHYDRTGTIINCNEGFARYVGATVPTMAGKNAVEFIHPDERTKGILAIRHCIAQPGTYHNIVFYKKLVAHHTKDAETHWEFIYLPEEESEESGIHCIGYIAGNVRKKTIDKAETQNKMLTHAIEQSPVSVIITNADSIIEYVNPHFCHTTGYTAQEVIGQRPSILKSGQTPQEVYAEMWEALTDGRSWSGFFSNKTKQGHIFWEYAVISPVFGNDGKIINYIAVKENVTERKELESKLLANEHRLQLATSASQTGLWDINLATNEVIYNEEWAAMVGYTLEELQPITHDTFLNLLHPDDRPKVEESLRQCVENNANTYDAEIRMRHKDGHWVWILGRGRVVSRSEAGEPTRIMGTHINISKQKETEDILKQQEEALRTINERFELATDAGEIGIWEIDPSRNLIIPDTKAVRMFGLPIGTTTINIDKWLDGVHRKDQLFLANQLTELGKGRQSADVSFRYFMPNGVMKYFNAFARPKQDREDGHMVLVGVIYDTTTLNYTRASLEKRERLLSAVADALGIMLSKGDVLHNIEKGLQRMGKAADADRAYLFVHTSPPDGQPYFRQALEWTSGNCQPQIDNPALQHIGHSTFPKLTSTLQTRKTYQSIVAYEPDEALRKDWESQQIQSVLITPIFVGQECWGFIGFDDCRHPRKWGQHEIDTINAFAKAIAEAVHQHRSDKALKEAREAAEAANKAKSQFLANMSHEIRTPLNGVIGFTELLSNLTLEPIQRRYVDNIQTSATSLMGIINDILDFSKIEAGKMELDETRTDIIELAELTMDMVKVAASRKGIELLLNIDPSVPRFTIVDSMRLRQVMVNLLSNAIKFTEKGEVELLMHFIPDKEDSGMGHYRFSVRDTGIGITQEQQSRLFQAFTQADASTTKRYGGTGLGLVISAKLLEYMRSKLILESHVGVGSTFSFTLHRSFEHGDAFTYRPVTSISNVLIIDDNEKNRVILRHMINQWGLTTTEAADGYEALERIKEEKEYSVIIVDYNMPGINGLEVIQRIREEHLSDPEKQAIVMYTSSDDPEVVRGCQKLGVRYRVEKPVKMKELYRILSKAFMHERQGAGLALPVGSIDDNKEQQIAHSGGLKVLIAEDNTINMALVKFILAKILPDALPIEAVNGVEAVSKYRVYMPDLVLMDMQMPEMDGLEATRTIRQMEQELDRRVPILALTANAMSGERENCLNAGMDDYLTKPLQQKLLADMLKRHLTTGTQHIKN